MAWTSSTPLTSSAMSAKVSRSSDDEVAWTEFSPSISLDHNKYNRSDLFTVTPTHKRTRTSEDTEGATRLLNSDLTNKASLCFVRRVLQFYTSGKPHPERGNDIVSSKENSSVENMRVGCCEKEEKKTFFNVEGPINCSSPESRGRRQNDTPARQTSCPADGRNCTEQGFWTVHVILLSALNQSRRLPTSSLENKFTKLNR